MANHKKAVATSSNQSLFQIYYLGRTPVDRRCSSVVMPWIIEELKLNAEEMKLIWLTPGEGGRERERRERGRGGWGRDR